MFRLKAEPGESMAAERSRGRLRLYFYAALVLVGLPGWHHLFVVGVPRLWERYQAAANDPATIAATGDGVSSECGGLRGCPPGTAAIWTEAGLYAACRCLKVFGSDLYVEGASLGCRGSDCYTFADAPRRFPRCSPGEFLHTSGDPANPLAACLPMRELPMEPEPDRISLAVRGSDRLRNAVVIEATDGGMTFGDLLLVPSFESWAVGFDGGNVFLRANVGPQ